MSPLQGLLNGDWMVLQNQKRPHPSVVSPWSTTGDRTPAASSSPSPSADMSLCTGNRSLPTSAQVSADDTDRRAAAMSRSPLHTGRSYLVFLTVTCGGVWYANKANTSLWEVLYTLQLDFHLSCPHWGSSTMQSQFRIKLYVLDALVPPLNVIRWQ